MYITTARFKSTCKQTGRIVKKGDKILYCKDSKSVYSEHSSKFKEFKPEYNQGFNLDNYLEQQSEYFCPSQNY